MCRNRSHRRQVTDFIQELRSEIEERKVLLVVGAGVSIASSNDAACSSWRGLLENGINHVATLGLTDSKTQDAMLKLLQESDTEALLSVAEYVERKLELSSRAYGDWLQKAVGGLNPDRPAILNALNDLQLPIATTNYDHLIEKLTERKPITWGDERDAMDFAREHNPLNTVLHLHGDFEKPESVVLGIRSYTELLGNGHAEAILRALTIRYTLLFIGFGSGLGDPNFKALFNWIERTLEGHIHCHFRLVTRAELETISPQPARRIQAVSYGDDYNDLPTFLKQLELEYRVQLYPYRFSPQPQERLCIGHNTEIRDLNRALMLTHPEPIIVLGNAGIGKSTICLAALHAPDVEARYESRRHFIRLDTAKSADALVAEVAAALKVGIGFENSETFDKQTQQTLASRIIDTLASAEGPTVLVLDSAESPWDADEIGTEDFLASLAQAFLNRAHLCLVVVVRGHMRPFGVPWNKRVELLPLSDKDSEDLFLQVVTQNTLETARIKSSTNFRFLVSALDGNPLAIDLLARAAFLGTDIDVIFKRWKEVREHFLMEMAANDLMLPLKISIKVALDCDHVSQKAKRILSVLGHLPYGLAYCDIYYIFDFDNLSTEIDALIKTGLAFREDERLRLVPPVSEYMRGNVNPHDEDLNTCISHFLNLAQLGKAIGWGIGGASAVQQIERLKREAGNIGSVIYLTLQNADCKRGVISALAFGRFQRFTGIGTPELVESALQIAGNMHDPFFEAECLRVLASMLRMRSQTQSGRQYCERAFSKYQEIVSPSAKLGRTHCLRAFGDFERVQGHFANAQTYYEQALPEYRDLLNNSGEYIEFDVENTKRGLANCLQRLGDVSHLWKREDINGCLVRAGEFYEQALGMYKEIGDIIGEANCKKGFGDIAVAREAYEEGYKYYTCAKEKYANIGYQIGVANCAYSIGDIELRLNHIERARESYLEARKLYSEIHAIHGLANCEYSLGDMQILENSAEKATKSYERAKLSYQHIGSRLGPANSLQGLADAYDILGDGAEARKCRRQAMDLAREAFDWPNDTDVPFSYRFPANNPRYGRWRR